MIIEDPYWYHIRPSRPRPEISAVPTEGKWLCFGPKEEMHLYLELMNTLVEDGTFRSVKLARKDPEFDLFPHKDCVMSVFTSGGESEMARVKSRLIQIGLNPVAWKSEVETIIDWTETGKLQLEAEIMMKKKQLSSNSSAEEYHRSSIQFDVFLCHNSSDKPMVLRLAEALRNRGLSVWVDEWELVPGRPWQEALEEVIQLVMAAAVLVGSDGVGPWQDREMRGFLSEFVRRKLPVIPVLLPGAPEKPNLPIFLKEFTWVDLRSGLSKNGLDRLQWGITGKKPPG